MLGLSGSEARWAASPAAVAWACAIDWVMPQVDEAWACAAATTAWAASSAWVAAPKWRGPGLVAASLLVVHRGLAAMELAHSPLPWWSL
ncbi:hypothetical protein EV1_028302 [Malus domestica]